MNPDNAMGCLEARWGDYLKKRGHQIYQSQSDFRVVRSRNSKRVRYRWLLLVSERAIRRLSTPDRAYIRTRVRQARKLKETAYLVIGFIHEPKRIVVLPAGAALRARYVRSDKGGIAWDD